MSVPSIVTVPEVGRSRPARTFISVDLPGARRAHDRREAAGREVDRDAAQSVHGGVSLAVAAVELAGRKRSAGRPCQSPSHVSLPRRAPTTGPAPRRPIGASALHARPRDAHAEVRVADRPAPAAQVPVDVRTAAEARRARLHPARRRDPDRAARADSSWGAGRGSGTARRSAATRASCRSAPRRCSARSARSPRTSTCRSGASA